MTDSYYFEFNYEDKSIIDLIQNVRNEKLKNMTDDERERYLINEKKIQHAFDKNWFNFCFPLFM